MTNEELERRVAALEDDHRLTRWYTGRVDHDLAIIANIQGEHTRRLVSIEMTQAEHTATLTEHTAILTGHSTTLAKHSEMLAKHTEMLVEHSETLAEHTARFDSVDAQLQSLTGMVGEVLNRLPASGPASD